MKRLIEAKTRKQTQSIATWASIIKKVTGGYMAFQYISDYDTWKNNK
jgi:hypothetical protein